MIQIMGVPDGAFASHRGLMPRALMAINGRRPDSNDDGPMTDSALRLPRRNPRAFLALAAIAWLGLYLALEPVADALANALPLDRGGRFAAAVHFFVYDTPKVLLLLTGVVFAMG